MKFYKSNISNQNAALLVSETEQLFAILKLKQQFTHTYLIYLFFP